MGIYMWVCFFFAICSLIQTVAVIYIDKLRKSIKENIEENKEFDANFEKQMGVAESSEAVRWNPLFFIFKFNMRMRQEKERGRKRSKLDRHITDPGMLRVCPFVKLMVQVKVRHTQIKYRSRTGQNTKSLTWSFGLISKKKVNIGKLLRIFLNNLKLNFFFLFSGIEA